jgi:AraC-like DNA-binding protein
MSALESYVRPREGVVRYFGIDALNDASRELRRAVPEDTVGQIAMRNGLVHLGRFSVSFRKVFGESPSETIRAGRRRAA